MQPNDFIKQLKEYPLASHKAWEYDDKSKVLKMDWNESDLTLPGSVKQAVTDFVNNGPSHWYPDIANEKLITALATYVGVHKGQVQYFAGEDSALDYAVRTFVAPGDEVGLIAPTYDNFRVYVESVGAIPTYLFTRDPFTSDIQELRAAITPQMKLVYLVNPNNPTGVLYSPDEIEVLLKEFPNTLFLVDEAYAEFAGVSSIPLIANHSNLIVGRSLSKAFGLASYRLGYLVTNSENLAHINKIRNGKGISALAQVAALAALADTSYVERYVREVREARSLLCDEFEKRGLVTRSTPANFVLVEVDSPSDFRHLLQKKAVFIRDLSHLPRMERFARISIGTIENVKELLRRVDALLPEFQGEG